MIIAVDPGVSGGIAWSDCENESCCKMPPNHAEAARLFQDLTKVNNVRHVAFIEDVPKWTGHVLPGATLAVLFENLGSCRGLLTHMASEVIMVTPRVWQAPLNLGGPRDYKDGAAWKRALKEEAQRRFPRLGSLVTLKTADALLILDWGRTNCGHRIYP